MTKADQINPEHALDGLFAEARAVQPAPSDALLRAIYEDAATLNAARRAVRPGGLLSWLRMIAEPVGGIGGTAALAGCIAVGFWVGFSAPLDLPGVLPEIQTEEEITFQLFDEDEDFSATLFQES